MADLRQAAQQPEPVAMTERTAKKLTPNNIANLVMADNAWHDSLYVKAEDYDLLLAEVEALREALRTLVKEPVRYVGNRIEIDCKTHSDAMRLIWSARAVLDTKRKQGT